jgi:hypothetical protein
MHAALGAMHTAHQTMHVTLHQPIYSIVLIRDLFLVLNKYIHLDTYGGRYVG